MLFSRCRRAGRSCLDVTLLLLVLFGYVAPTAAEPTPEVVIEGVANGLKNNIRSHLAIVREPCSATERRLRLMLRGVDKEVSQALQALGYYRSTAETELTMKDKCWRLRVTVDPGEPVVIARLDIQLETDAEGQALFRDYLSTLPLKQGAVLNHQHYSSSKSGIMQHAQYYGYLDAVWSRHRLEIHREKNEAVIELHLQTGKRYFLGPVSFEQDVYDPDFLQRFVAFQPGDPYRGDLLVAFHQDLNNSRYFHSVDLNADMDHIVDDRIPVKVKATPIAKYGTTVGAGFSTDTGPRGSFGFENRRVNARGHRYLFETAVSGVESEVGFDYQLPGRNPRRERINFETGWVKEQTDTHDSETFRVGVNRTDQVYSDWVTTNGVEYLNEKFDLADVSTRSQLVLATSNWTKTRSDHPTFPTRGWRLSGTLRGALENLASDVDLVQVILRAKAIVPLGKGRLISRVEAAGSGVSDFALLPASLRFFAGGDSSVRGYDYQSLGPVNENGDVLGGKHMVTASIEYDRLVWRNYGFALFYDMGNAFDNSQFDLQSGVGAGLRWHSPIGPIRVDVATSLENGGVRLHLSMGPDL